MKLEGCKEERTNDIVKSNLWKLTYLIRSIYYVAGIMLSKCFTHSLT